MSECEFNQSKSLIYSVKFTRAGSIKLEVSLYHHKQSSLSVPPLAPILDRPHSSLDVPAEIHLQSSSLPLSANSSTDQSDPINVLQNPVSIKFSVSDTGCGISPEMLPHLFNPYSQAKLSVWMIVVMMMVMMMTRMMIVDHSCSGSPLVQVYRLHGGTGLGLSIVKRIIAKMHGHINVQSKVGQGTTFVFDILLGTSPPPQWARDRSNTTVMVAANEANNPSSSSTAPIPLGMSPPELRGEKRKMAVLIDTLKQGGRPSLIRQTLPSSQLQLQSMVTAVPTAVPTATTATLNSASVSSTGPQSSSNSPSNNTILSDLPSSSSNQAAPPSTMTNNNNSINDNQAGTYQQPVLVVEDSPINKKLIIKMLDNLQLSTLSASDGSSPLSIDCVCG